MGEYCLDDSQTRTITSQASSSLPILLPWSSSIAPVLPGTAFRSILASTDAPWATVSPFTELGDQLIVYTNDDGGLSTYNSAKSTSSSSNSEHLSVSLGVSVGCPFLNASASGQYDKDVLENKDVG